jgi:hypothetical protein
VPHAAFLIEDEAQRHWHGLVRSGPNRHGLRRDKRGGHGDATIGRGGKRRVTGYLRGEKGVNARPSDSLKIRTFFDFPAHSSRQANSGISRKEAKKSAVFTAVVQEKSKFFFQTRNRFFKLLGPKSP